LDLGSNYYVAVSVHFTGTGVEATFFIKDLTTDSELHSSIVTAGNTSMYNSTADFTIGATYQDGVDARHFSGLIDEVRLSNTALSEGQLLTIPEPAESAMFLSTGLLMLALLRRLRLKK
jgi:hypothetical protein